MEYLVLLGLILFNGLFAMSEIAIVTARKSRLEALAQQGKRSAALALKLAEDPTQFLSTVQIGITSIGLLSGIYGESVLAGPFASYLATLGVAPELASILATAAVVVVVTYLSIVAGELVPKRIGQIRAEAIACAVAGPMALLALAAKPFVYLLSASTHSVMQLAGIGDRPQDSLTQEDIHAVLQEGSSAGLIEHHEHMMVKNVFRLDERPIESLMVPRSGIVYLDTSKDLQQTLATVMGSPHSRFPVCRDGIEHLVGVVSAKQLLAESMAGRAIHLEALARPCHFVPESLSGMELLEHFRTSRMQMVFVVDEYGDMKGLVTLHDMMDALTGVTGQDSGLDDMVVRRQDGSLLLDGLLPVPELKDALDLRALPDEAGSHYQTLNGLVMYMLGKVPATADVVALPPWRLEIVDMDGKRIDKVLAMRTDGQDENTAG